jgi:hypothetical protein
MAWSKVSCALWTKSRGLKARNDCDTVAILLSSESDRSFLLGVASSGRSPRGACAFGALMKATGGQWKRKPSRTKSGGDYSSSCQGPDVPESAFPPGTSVTQLQTGGLEGSRNQYDASIETTGIGLCVRHISARAVQTERCISHRPLSYDIRSDSGTLEARHLASITLEPILHSCSAVEPSANISQTKLPLRDLDGRISQAACAAPALSRHCSCFRTVESDCVRPLVTWPQQM